MTAYTLYKNGNIRTMDESMPKADSVVVSGDRFAYVGTESGARDFIEGKGGFDKETDLDGKLVLPGFNDSHMHLVHFAKSIANVSLVGTKSLAELKSRLKEALRNRKAGSAEWLVGEGWNHDYFEDEKRFPNYKDLDEVSDEVPIIVMRACFHVGTLNSAAMKILGINRESAPSYGELVGLFENGEPDGVLKESLLDKIKSEISPPSPETIKELLGAAQERALEQGITSVQSDDVHYMPNADYALLFRIFREMEETGTLRLRISEQCLLQEVPVLEGFFADGYHEGWGTDKYRVGCLKLLSDGSLGARTAALKEPYADDRSVSGLALFTQEELDALVMTAHRHGCPTAVHAIGNRALEMALDAVEKAQKSIPSPLRHGIVHCQITDERQLERLAELNAQVFAQPIFIDYDMNIVEQRVGPELAGTSYAWRSMADKGIHVSFGSDCPVESFNTMPNIYTAVTRRNITGDGRVYLPEQAMSMEQAIKSYTAEGAYATNEEGKKGTITVGKLADFIVLDKDLFNLPDEGEILRTKVLETYVGGKLEYSREAACA